MKNFQGRGITVSATALFLAVCVCISTFLIPAGVKNAAAMNVSRVEANAEKSHYTLDSSKIAYNPEAKRADYDNNFEYLLARDGFVYGVDYDWQGMNLYSDHSLGDQNIFLPSNGSATFNKYIAYNDIYNMKALGFNATNYWLLISLQGITFDEQGYCTGVQDNFMNNLRDLLEICREVGMMLIPTLQPHGEASSYGNINDQTGMSPNDVWNKYFKFIWQDKARAAYMNNVIDPICQLLAEYQDTILCVGLTVENTTGWINDVDYGYVQCDYGTTWENWANFSNDMNAHVKKFMPNMLTSTEEGGGTEKVYRYNDLDVDLMGANYYHSEGYIEPRSSYFSNRPGYVGECNIADGRCDYDISSEYYGKKRHQFLKYAAEGGWLGCFLFQWTSEGDDCNIFVTNESTLNYDAMYSWLVEYRYLIGDKINAFRGITNDVEAPCLLANKGGRDVYWIASRQAVSYRLERSADGGKSWEVINAAIDPDYNARNNGLIMYTDTSAGVGMTTSYRVTAVGENGSTATSEPNNSCEFFVPNELVTNGGFETGDFSTWNRSTTAQITNEDSYEGNYCLKIDRSDENRTGHYWGLGQDHELKPNTAYNVEFYYKCTKAGNGGEPPFVRAWSNSNSKNLYVHYMGGNVTDSPQTNGWIKIGFKFTTGPTDTNVCLDINCGAVTEPYLIYLDQFSLKEQR